MDIVAAEQGRHPRIRRQGGGGKLLPVNAGSGKEIIEEGRDPFAQQRLQLRPFPGQRRFEATDNIGPEDALRIGHLPFGQRPPLRIKEATGEGGGAEVKGKKEFAHDQV
jgi:hypothetical protein